MMLSQRISTFGWSLRTQIKASPFVTLMSTLASIMVTREDAFFVPEPPITRTTALRQEPSFPEVNFFPKRISKVYRLLNGAPEAMRCSAAGGTMVAFRPPSSDLARSRHQP